MTEHKIVAEKMAEIVALCKRYAHPGVNTGAHELAHKILQITGEIDSGKAKKGAAVPVCDAGPSQTSGAANP